MPSVNAESDDWMSEINPLRTSATFPLNHHDEAQASSSQLHEGSAKRRVRVNGFPNGFHNGPNGTNGGMLTPELTPDPERAQSHEAHDFGAKSPEATGPRSRPYARMRTWDGDQDPSRFPRISKPMELMRSSYDCVVIGSGYGGGVAASRMARTGQSVCVLERGQERWPGEYPSETGDCLDQVHYSGEFAPGWMPKKLVNGGDPTGMYHLIFGNEQNALVGNGLGGTSLINANVWLPADKNALTLEDWPEEIRNNPGCLDEYYKKAEEVLEPEAYPEDWPTLPKLELLKRQSEHLNMRDKFHRVKQTTRFRNGPNSCGVEMSPSALTGQDCTGVNDGSKNTTLVTYIADAWNWGAEIFCDSEVRYITEAPGDREGYIIYFAWHGRNRGHFKANLHGDLMWVHARSAVFLGAGSIGTTEILLRSREMGLTTSPEVGQNMSGNGDILAFGYNTDYESNSIGRAFPSPYHPIGPCITGIIDNRDGHKNPIDGYVIEEGTMPAALAPFLQAMLEFMPGSVNFEESLVERAKANLARMGSAFLGPYFSKGAMEKTQVYLIMSHDSNQAILRLKDDKPVLEFVGAGRADHVNELHRVLENATKSVGGTFVHNPWYSLMGKNQITVHPIGGAHMARDNTPNTGVTNHAGEVYTGEGSKVHKGLIVTDAAAIPTALGANPFATITALAERAVDLYAKREGLTIHTKKNGLLDLFGSPKSSLQDQKLQCNEENEEFHEAHSIYNAKKAITSAKRMNDGGFGFTEVMSGYVHHDTHLTRDHPDTYERAASIAKSQCETARFFLSVQSFNSRVLVHDPDHRAMLTGTFACPTIPGSPFMVQRGNFNLFLLDLKAPGTRNLTYNFDMRGVDGRKLHFYGYKVVDSSVALAPFQYWKATSTLYVTITEPLPGTETDPKENENGRRGKVVAKGIMRIEPHDLASQVLTLTPTGSSLLRKVTSAAKFFTFFTRKSLSLFLSPLTPLQYPAPMPRSYTNDTPHSKKYKIVAADDVVTTMYMWEPTNTDIPTKNLFMIPGASVDHQIYALPTISFNAVNYFCRAGYRVFIPVHRIGAIMVAQGDWTTFDARLDLKAAFQKARDLFPPRDEHDDGKFYTIAHCMGSVAFSAGLLDGTIPADWIKGVTCSQVFMNPVWNVMNMIKIMAAPIPLDRIYRLLAGSWFSCNTSKNDSLIQRALNEILRFMPDERREICNNASCHRISLCYARCWNHRNLNEVTHRQIDRFFGGVNMTLLHLLMKQGYEGHVMTNAPLYQRLDTPENIERLRGVPFLLFVGRDNAVLSQQATETTYELLTERFGTTADDGINYRRRVVPDYGHLDCWMGRNAWKDVYPFVLEEVDRVCRGEDYTFKEPDDRWKWLVQEGHLVY